MNKGFFLSLEAAVSLLALASIIVAAMPQAEEEESLKEIIILQKENDLLKAWAKKASFEENEMLSDFQLAFPEQSGKIILNGGEIQIGEKKQNAIASRMVFFQKNMEKTEITLIVFYQ